MCTYGELKKKKIINYVYPLQGVNGAPNGIDISKYIEGGSMKITTLVDYIYV